MKNQINLLTIIVLSLSIYHVNANEILLYNKDTLHLNESILSKFKDYDSISNQILASTTYTENCRSRRFTEEATWIIKNDSLFLRDLKFFDYCTGKEIPFRFNEIYDLNFANWFSDEIKYGIGRVLYSSYVGRFSGSKQTWNNVLHKYGGKLYFKNGILKTNETWSNKAIVSDYLNSLNRDSLIYSNINWKKISNKKLKKNYVVDISFEVDKNGQLINKYASRTGTLNNDSESLFIEKVKVNAKIVNEALRVIDLIPYWSHYFENGKPYKQRGCVIRIVFSEKNKIKYGC